jgi:hypothetical protein
MKHSQAISHYGWICAWNNTKQAHYHEDHMISPAEDIISCMIGNYQFKVIRNSTPNFYLLRQIQDMSFNIKCELIKQIKSTQHITMHFHWQCQSFCFAVTSCACVHVYVCVKLKNKANAYVLVFVCTYYNRKYFHCSWPVRNKICWYSHRWCTIPRWKNLWFYCILSRVLVTIDGVWIGE